MADLHNLFVTFNTSITLTSAKSNNLRTSRDSLRKSIKEWFSDSQKKQPNFCWQGSFAMKTTTNPLSSGEYDIDDGIYLAGYEDTDNTKWPSTATVHSWIESAVKGKTKATPINKNTCIRVPYASGYHVDLPIYIKCNNDIYLAHKSKGWTLSDPKAFKDWFIDAVNDNDEQLRRVVKYLKAWKDYKGVALKGIEITILVVNNFSSYEGRDDKSLRDTVQAIIDTLDESFECKKPVTPYEDLFEGISDTKKNSIITALTNLRKALNNAILEDDEQIASNYLIKEFGSRFPKGESKKENSTTASYVHTSKPGVLKHDGRSA